MYVVFQGDYGYNSTTDRWLRENGIVSDPFNRRVYDYDRISPKIFDFQIFFVQGTWISDF